MPKEVFAEHFWACHDALQAAATEEVGMPGYFRFMTLLGGLGKVGVSIRVQVFGSADPKFEGSMVVVAGVDHACCQQQQFP